MKDRSLKILLGIIAVNLTLQTINQIGLFPTANAASGIQKIALCDEYGRVCAEMEEHVAETDKNRQSNNHIAAKRICGGRGGSRLDILCYCLIY